MQKKKVGGSLLLTSLAALTVVGVGLAAFTATTGTADFAIEFIDDSSTGTIVVDSSSADTTLQVIEETRIVQFSNNIQFNYTAPEEFVLTEDIQLKWTVTLPSDFDTYFDVTTTTGVLDQDVGAFNFETNSTHYTLPYNALGASLKEEADYDAAKTAFNGEKVTITVETVEPTSTDVPVSSIEINSENLTLKVGDTTTLTATVNPDNATDKTITWSSSTPAVATISDAGVINALDVGQTTITAKAGEQTDSITLTVEEKSSQTETIVETGKLGLWQTGLNKALYFTGAMDGYYFGTTETYNDGVTIDVIEAAEGVYLKIQDGQYIAARLNEGHNNIIMQDDPYAWSYNDEYDAYYTNLGANDLWIGNSQSYDTLSLNDWDYIANAGNNVAHVVQAEIEAPEIDVPVDVDTGVDLAEGTFKLGFYQKTLQEYYYFTGEAANTYYGGSTTNIAEAADITVDVIDEAANTFTMQLDSGKYLGATVSGNYTNFVFNLDDPFTWTYDDETHMISATVDTTELYIGTYGSFNTFSVSTMDHLENSDTCLAHLYASSTDPNPEPEPEPEPSDALASYNITAPGSSTTEIDGSALLSILTSACSSGTNIITEITATSKVYEGYNNYLNLGLKFGTSSKAGTFTASLNTNVSKVVIKAAGWKTSDTLSVNDVAQPTPFTVTYADADPLLELTYTFTATNTVTFNFANRGFIQSIEFYA